MLAYFVVSASTALLAATGRSRYSGVIYPRLSLRLAFLFLTFFVGLRYQVGSDWGGYLRVYQFIAENGFFASLGRTEPGYMLLNWIAAWQFGLGAEQGIWFVNLGCAAISMYCLLRFCEAQNRPALAAYILVSYFVIVIVAGLTRQGTAASVTMLALVYLCQGRQILYLAMIAFAMTFHTSALVMAPLAVVARDRHVIVYVFGGIAFIVAVALFAFELVGDTVMVQYIDRELGSGGAFQRVFVLVSAASLFLVFRRRFLMGAVEQRVYFSLSLAAFVLFALLFLFPSSTVIDRIAFFATPLQVFVYSNLPNVALGNKGFSGVVLFGVLVLFASKFSSWLIFGATADRFLPYRNFVFEPSEAVW